MLESGCWRLTIPLVSTDRLITLKLIQIKRKKREKQKKKESRSKVEDGEGGVRISVDMEIDRVLVFWSSVLEFRLPPGTEWE